ncbi:MAG: hypothetical protein JSV62_14465 [Promethearchaeota archaeon]|nr:MAG: hypothetical protein JSV62_14465 [Candidatus Lokiarchaeota archaeon]
MLKKRIIGIILIVIIGCSLIIFIPIQIISIHLSSYSTINEFYSFIYQPSSPFPIEKLYINADEGNIEIRYKDPPVDYYVLIEVNIELRGKNLEKKSCDDYLNILWYNASSPVNFILEIVSDDWFNPSLWLIKDVSIIVNLRKDIVFDLLTNLDEGDFEIIVPYAVSIGNLLTNVSNGNIYYDFVCSSIQGNITGITNNGDLELKSHNVEYTQNSNWSLISTGGYMNIEIYQYKEMGANITGTAVITNGELSLFYKDNTANIGACFFFPFLPMGVILPQEGFNISFQGLKTWLISSDFPTINNYNLSYYLLDSGFGLELHSD